MLTATERHPWRPAHLHAIVRAPGYQSVATHVFHDESDYLDSDAVFGVKRSLIRHFERHEAGSDGRPTASPRTRLVLAEFSTSCFDGRRTVVGETPRFGPNSVRSSSRTTAK